MSNSVMNQFKEHPDSWQCVDKVLDQSQNPDTKFFALQILDQAVNTRWNVIPED